MVKANKVKEHGWSLDNADVSVRVKPRRPYTPYNIFYLLERELMVQEPKESLENVSPSASVNGNPEDQLELPARYKGIVMSPSWYDPNRKEKRKHRRTHGKISFQELTEQISKNWATIDEESKNYCTTISEIGRKRYKQNLNRFIASKKIMELKEEKSMMIAARGRLGGLHEAGTPPRLAKARQQQHPAPTIHAVTPDRSHPKTYYEEHAPKYPPVVTPPYNAYANRRPMYYQSAPYYGHATPGPPPPLPPPPPPMPHQVSPAYHHPNHSRMPPSLPPPMPPPPMPPPMPSNSSMHHEEYYQSHVHSHYRVHSSPYPGGYSHPSMHSAGHNGYHQRPTSNAHRKDHSGYHYYENSDRYDPSYAPAAARHWNHNDAAGYNSSVYQPAKHEEDRHKKVQDNASRGHESKSPDARSKTHHETVNIYSTMSFDSIKSSQIQFNLSADNLSAYGASPQQQEGLGSSNHGDFKFGLQEDEESILGLLREDLVPFDTSSGIPFQLSWDREVQT